MPRRKHLGPAARFTINLTLPVELHTKLTDLWKRGYMKYARVHAQVEVTKGEYLLEALQLLNKELETKG